MPPKEGLRKIAQTTDLYNNSTSTQKMQKQKDLPASTLKNEKNPSKNILFYAPRATVSGSVTNRLNFTQSIMGGPLIPPWVALQPILLIIVYFRTKICQHTLFSNATLYLRLIKSKSVCLGGADRFFQILVKQRRPIWCCQWLSILNSPMPIWRSQNESRCSFTSARNSDRSPCSSNCRGSPYSASNSIGAEHGKKPTRSGARKKKASGLSLGGQL